MSTADVGRLKAEGGLGKAVAGAGCGADDAARLSSAASERVVIPDMAALPNGAGCVCEYPFGGGTALATMSTEGCGAVLVSSTGGAGRSAGGGPS